MDTTLTTTATISAQNQRDPSRHRRAYLDTYAKKRVKLDPARQPAVTTAHAAPIADVVPSIVNPVQQAQPVAPQPVGEAPVEMNYQPAVQADVVPRHKAYLDTLVSRHQAAVAMAPAATETVQPPTAASDLDVLMIDEQAQQAATERITANLQALYAPSLTEQITTNMQSASASHVRTIAASALICGLLSLGIFTALGKFDSQPVVAQPIGSPVIEVESANSPTPTGTPVVKPDITRAAVDPSQPIRMVISSVGVNAPVEGLGTTSDGLIAVPSAYGVVGWYNKGSVPGKPGPAVMVGHYAGGFGAVFDKLGDLNNGDLITTTNGRGQTYTYRVTKKAEYQRDKVPMQELFKKSDQSRLEIITCAGRWQTSTYNNRLVITAELVQ